MSPLHGAWAPSNVVPGFREEVSPGECPESKFSKRIQEASGLLSPRLASQEASLVCGQGHKGKSMWGRS